MSSYPALLDTMMNAILAHDLAPARQLYPNKNGFTAEEQLAVYVNGYRIRLKEVLENTYPALLYYLGHQDFTALAGGFIEKIPSRYYNLDKYPISFADYIVHTSNDIFARELAMVESAIHAVYMGEESAALSPSWLDRQTPDSLAASIFLPRIASRLLEFHYPINDYTNAFRAEEHPSKPAPAKTWLLVFRHHHQVQRIALVEAEYMLLTILAEAMPLGEALADERFAPFAENANLATEFRDWFAHWVTKGCLRQL